MEHSSIVQFVELNIKIKMEKLYHIIRVFEYKGGKLYTQPNLSYEQFINELGDMFIERYLDYEFGAFVELNSEILNWLKERNSNGEILNYIFENSSEYAGNDYIVYEFYYTMNNQMIALELTQKILDEVVDYFININTK